MSGQKRMCDWMRDLPSSLRIIPLHCLLLPGTRVSKRRLKRSPDLYQLLATGARVLELPVSHHAKRDCFYFETLPAAEALLQVIRFLELHQEVVLLRIVTQLADPLAVRFLNEAVERLGDHLIPPQPLSSVCLDRVDRGVILCFEKSPNQLVWRLPWLDSGRRSIDEFLQVAQACPNHGKRLTNLYLAEPGQRRSLDNGAVGLQQVNVITTDSMTDQFVQWIVDYNLRLGTTEGACVRL